jgi:hypothetical protein
LRRGGFAHPGFECGQAEGLEHVLPSAQAGVLGLDGGLDGLALGLGQPLPGGAELGLAGLVVLGQDFFAGAALRLLDDRELLAFARS